MAWELIYLWIVIVSPGLGSWTHGHSWNRAEDGLWAHVALDRPDVMSLSEGSVQFLPLTMIPSWHGGDPRGPCTCWDVWMKWCGSWSLGASLCSQRSSSTRILEMASLLRPLCPPLPGFPGCLSENNTVTVVTILLAVASSLGVGNWGLRDLGCQLWGIEQD